MLESLIVKLAGLIFSLIVGIIGFFVKRLLDRVDKLERRDVINSAEIRSHDEQIKMLRELNTTIIQMREDIHKVQTDIAVIKAVIHNSGNNSNNNNP